MRHYDSEQTGYKPAALISLRDRGTNPVVTHEPLNAANNHRLQTRPAVMKLADSAGQAGAQASLLQLQRQHGNQFVQRFLQVARSADEEGGVMPDVERAIESSRGGGHALDSGIQAQMGSALGADFSDVRVHTDAGADELNRSLSARAFTTGRDIYFRQGEYSPGSSGGRELLAHELTHVVQQNPDKVQPKSDDEGSKSGCTCGSVSGPQMKLAVSQPGDPYEQEADRIAQSVMHHEQQANSPSSQGQLVNRQLPEEDKEQLQAKYHDDTIRRQMEEEEKPT